MYAQCDVSWGTAKGDVGTQLLSCPWTLAGMHVVRGRGRQGRDSLRARPSNGSREKRVCTAHAVAIHS